MGESGREFGVRPTTSVELWTTKLALPFVQWEVPRPSPVPQCALQNGCSLPDAMPAIAPKDCERALFGSSHVSKVSPHPARWGVIVHTGGSQTACLAAVHLDDVCTTAVSLNDDLGEVLRG